MCLMRREIQYFDLPSVKAMPHFQFYSKDLNYNGGPTESMESLNVQVRIRKRAQMKLFVSFAANTEAI
jgi:hypothetical protein